ncbi:MAG: glycosyltransferase family 39 protein [Candidatus Levybacteria bacterium]|nr:glycosyltransferase family 39 protein [Candidatus Levybacteria bacterium]
MGKKKVILLIMVLGLGLGIRIYKLPELMPFIGDQGWFYLSARDMILNAQIPLVGITSSHTWLHQGPLWTYILAFILWVSNFDPISGGVFTAILGVFTIFVIYKVGSRMFSEKVGIISSILYATSPLIIDFDRTPYHTSPIPFFVLLLFFTVYKWIKGKRIFFPISVFLLQILYNFELATQVLWFALLFLLCYGILKKKIWAISLFKPKIIILSLLSFILPMLPVIIYDFTYGFSQTFKFMLWVPYRVLRQFNLLNNFSSPIEGESFFFIIAFLKRQYQRLIFMSNGFIAMAIFFASFISIFLFFLNKFKQKHIIPIPLLILFIFIIIPLIGLVVNKTPSEAYLPILFPTAILVTGWLFSLGIKYKILTIPTIILLVFIATSNLFSFLKSLENQISYKTRLNISRKIVQQAQGKEYNLVGKGDGSQFRSFTMNYEYLAWWLGNEPSQKNEKLKFIIDESNNKIRLERKINF